MRADMFKVIVERPRWTRSRSGGSAYPRGELRSRSARDFEDSPRTESMGGTYASKSLNENLQPLVRFLQSNVGRPWRLVHSEMAACLSCRSAVQKHVLDHLKDYVAEHVFVEGKTILVKSWRGLEPIVSRGGRLQFYVCPRTGLLRLAPQVPRKRRVGRSDVEDRRVLSSERELRRIDGIWYEITVAPIPHGAPALGSCFDVVERVDLGSMGRGLGTHPLWRSGRYAARKRQLGSHEITRFGLRDPHPLRS